MGAGGGSEAFLFHFFLFVFGFGFVRHPSPRAWRPSFLLLVAVKGGVRLVWFTGGGYGGDEKRMEPRSRTENENESKNDNEKENENGNADVR